MVDKWSWGDEFQGRLGEQQFRPPPGAPPAGMGGAGTGVSMPRPMSPGVPVGGPSIPRAPGSVTSVFDTRPVNGRDFAGIYSTLTNNGVVSQTGDVWYLVPPGFVAIIRELSWAFYTAVGYPPAASVTRATALSTFLLSGVQLLINGVDANVFDSAQPVGAPAQSAGAQQWTGPLMPAAVNSFHTHVIADQGTLIDLKLTLPTPVYLAQIFRGMIRGTLLQSRGLPAAFEVVSSL